jgi:hypothetical protein
MAANFKKSLRAILAAILFVIVVTTLVDILLHVLKVYPAWDQPIDDKLSALATAYRIVISVAGTYLACWLAPQKPMKHAMILGAIGTVMGAAGAAATWNKGLGPHWYPIALAVLALPQSWLGAYLYERKHA